jgi:hypothetical protein
MTGIHIHIQYKVHNKAEVSVCNEDTCLERYQYMENRRQSVVEY